MKANSIQINFLYCWFYLWSSIWKNIPRKLYSFMSNWWWLCYFELSEEEEFEFPTNGIFITIKIYHLKEYKTLGFDYPPGITTIGVSKDNKNHPLFQISSEDKLALLEKYEYMIKDKTHIS